MRGSCGEKENEGRQLVGQSMGAAIQATLSEKPAVAGMCIDIARVANALPAVAGILKEEGHTERRSGSTGEQQQL